MSPLFPQIQPLSFFSLSYWDSSISLGFFFLICSILWFPLAFWRIHSMVFQLTSGFSVTSILQFTVFFILITIFYMLTFPIWFLFVISSEFFIFLVSSLISLSILILHILNSISNSTSSDIWCSVRLFFFFLIESLVLIYYLLVNSCTPRNISCSSGNSWWWRAKCQVLVHTNLIKVRKWSANYGPWAKSNPLFL